MKNTRDIMDLIMLSGHDPLEEYSWVTEVDRLLDWVKTKDSLTRCFIFDVVMSLAYLDASVGIEENIEFCVNTPKPYNSHLGFINLCSPCYEHSKKWEYQKAAKPQSGALGKLSSEIILRFILKLFDRIESVIAIGGSDLADARITLTDGTNILAEIKSAPLITYPIISSTPNSKKEHHNKLGLTRSQFNECESALYMHDKKIIPLGKPEQRGWPFKGCVDYICNTNNAKSVELCIATWIKARDAYINRDKENPIYYLTNACGAPPIIAKKRDGWKKESISDSKTSAGMDRTDDIKKGIYQVLKLGIIAKNTKNNEHIKTAIISNLPALRHGKEYIEPFVNMLWGLSSDIKNKNKSEWIYRKDLRWVFDFIITLDAPLLRGGNL